MRAQNSQFRLATTISICLCLCLSGGIQAIYIGLASKSKAKILRGVTWHNHIQVAKSVNSDTKFFVQTGHARIDLRSDVNILKAATETM